MWLGWWRHRRRRQCRRRSEKLAGSYLYGVHAIGFMCCYGFMLLRLQAFSVLDGEGIRKGSGVWQLKSQSLEGVAWLAFSVGSIVYTYVYIYIYIYHMYKYIHTKVNYIGIVVTAIGIVSYHYIIIIITVSIVGVLVIHYNNTSVHNGAWEERKCVCIMSMHITQTTLTRNLQSFQFVEHSTRAKNPEL